MHSAWRQYDGSADDHHGYKVQLPGLLEQRTILAVSVNEITSASFPLLAPELVAGYISLAIRVGVEDISYSLLSLWPVRAIGIVGHLDEGDRIIAVEEFV